MRLALALILVASLAGCADEGRPASATWAASSGSRPRVARTFPAPAGLRPGTKT